MGIEVNMMTGDSLPAAQAVARQVGIREERVFAGMSPKGKASKIAEMMEKGVSVAMVRFRSASFPLTKTQLKCSIPVATIGRRWDQ